MAEEPPNKKQMTTKHSTERVCLPGFGDDLEQEPGVPIALDWISSPISVHERSMIGLMLALKDKPEWDRKVFDDAIVARWKAEATVWRLERGSKAQNVAGSSSEEDPWNGSGNNGENLDVDGSQRQKDINEEDFDYCVAELRENAKKYQQRGFTEAIDASVCVYMSDTAVSAETKALLNASVKPLENVKEEDKDWHPGSDGKVLDLVHPSLFPLIYGRSRILPDSKVPLEKCSWSTGEGEIVPEGANGAEFGRYSDEFQWLPCEVSLDHQNNAKITSYINNLHPSGNEKLYEAIENIITASVPIWKQTILSTHYLCGDRIEHDFGDGWKELPGRPHPDYDETYEGCDDHDGCYNGLHYQVAIPKPKKFKPRMRAPRETFELGEAYQRARISDLDHPMRDPTIELNEEQIQEANEKTSAEAAHLQKIFAEQGLQVIVKLANIHLTPEKPTYHGGSWHIEGMLNEHICASALYYYNSENITDSYLAFREGVDRDELNEYEQSRYQALMEIYGINDSWGDAIQVLGSVHTREDRLLVFPNVLQHRVSPFELQDKSRPGHRKLLALFLVDPDIRIISTANVPPQQRDWWAKAMEEKGSLIQRLPVELADQVVQGVEDFPITLDEAKEIREKLMEERKTFVDSSMDAFTENGYCFCEH